MKVEDIRKILIVGSGTMGQQIAFQCALHGYDVTLYDISPEALEKAREGVARMGRWFVKAGRISGEQAGEIEARMSFTTDQREAAREADFLSESVPEDPRLKGKILGEFNGLCPERTIFTTNTSTLVPSMFAAATGRPDRFIAFHYYDIRISPIVDVMPHPGTFAGTRELAMAFARKTGLVPIYLEKENFGYVMNAMLMSIFSSALNMAETGVSSIRDIDRSWIGVMNLPVGPFGMMDSIGLETVWKVTDYWANAVNNEQGKRNARFVRDYVDRGKLGVKSGEGFYSYPHPAYMKPGFLQGEGE